MTVNTSIIKNHLMTIILTARLKRISKHVNKSYKILMHTAWKNINNNNYQYG